MHGMSLRMSPRGSHTQGFPLWINNTQAASPSEFLTFYAFNMTNSVEFERGEAKPLLEQIVRHVATVSLLL